MKYQTWFCNLSIIFLKTKPLNLDSPHSHWLGNDHNCSHYVRLSLGAPGWGRQSPPAWAPDKHYWTLKFWTLINVTEQTEKFCCRNKTKRVNLFLLTMVITAAHVKVSDQFWNDGLFFFLSHLDSQDSSLYLLIALLITFNILPVHYHAVWQ